jgi:hypothetical protein
MIPVMNHPVSENESPANLLCKACGLCCSGHLFSWVRLNAPELDPVQSLGVTVIRDDPRQRGFTQPCPLWDGVCTVYTSPHYPRSCKTYKCKVFKRLLDEDISFPDAVTVVQDTLSLIREIEPLLPESTAVSFRERVIAYKEELETKKGGHTTAEQVFLSKTAVLLVRYEDLFGVDDFIDYDA